MSSKHPSSRRRSESKRCTCSLRVIITCSYDTGASPSRSNFLLSSWLIPSCIAVREEGEYGATRARVFSAVSALSLKRFTSSFNTFASPGNRILKCVDNWESKVKYERTFTVRVSTGTMKIQLYVTLHGIILHKYCFY